MTTHLWDEFKVNHVLLQCNRTMALEEFFSMLFYSNLPIMALLGSGCSDASAATAELTHFYNLTQVRSRVSTEISLVSDLNLIWHSICC